MVILLKIDIAGAVCPACESNIRKHSWLSCRETMCGQGFSSQPKNILVPVVFLFPEQTARWDTLREKNLFSKPSVTVTCRASIWIFFSSFFSLFSNEITDPISVLGVLFLFISAFYVSFVQEWEPSVFFTKRKLGESCGEKNIFSNDFFLVSRFNREFCFPFFFFFFFFVLATVKIQPVVSSLTFRNILAPSAPRYDARDTTLRLSGRTDSWKQVERIGSYDRGIKEISRSVFPVRLRLKSEVKVHFDSKLLPADSCCTQHSSAP